MESSFKKAYDKETLPDGSIKLSFKADRSNLSWRYFAQMGALIFMVVIFSALFANTISTLFLIFTIGAIVLVKVIQIINGKSDILIQHDGIIYRATKTLGASDGLLKYTVKRQLAFKDADEWGLEIWNGKSCIYAHAGGTKLIITGYMKKELAQAILSEIRGHKVELGVEQSV